MKRFMAVVLALFVFAAFSMVAACKKAEQPAAPEKPAQEAPAQPEQPAEPAK